MDETRNETVVGDGARVEYDHDAEGERDTEARSKGNHDDSGGLGDVDVKARKNGGAESTEAERTESENGTVYLVGAGPGDPELLTLKAGRLLEEADSVLHDSLVDDGVLDLIPDSTDVVNVGKRPDGKTTPQDEINSLMVDEAREGKTVVRLKGGDPDVFGRGGEEAEHLASEDVEFEIVPGVTSVVAASGVSGIPLTHRNHSSSFTVITGHEDPTKEESAIDWEALARNIEAGGTLVILMGVRRLPDNVEALTQHGVDASTPAAMVEKATRDGEKYVTGSLENIVERTRDEGIESPAITVIGDVVKVRDEIDDLIL
ncbi:MAG: uroporphyrinogen-III C-methyltransferase [Halobacteria archaeon]|nr:uroporphyrinogen-III C-methyltransferase [Halobacteria archaeon]